MEHQRRRSTRPLGRPGFKHCDPQRQNRDIGGQQRRRRERAQAPVQQGDQGHPQRNGVGGAGQPGREALAAIERRGRGAGLGHCLPLQGETEPHPTARGPAHQTSSAEGGDSAAEGRPPTMGIGEAQSPCFRAETATESRVCSFLAPPCPRR
ncbi:hypothetical protein CC_3342 [Caulobacter vibrioides CB15]|uniref:Uncharacterized protein n=1 Tax=Caulobacter vibrioides (strain ATCC 19089 / CIP 103742 / CB 15) TaxID=190650 RepID=Q9A364_CAUVC|nr:hypothetical protein CC_3342 [Caulobacter vibrioides CB15]ATC30164.1 hypothetical protein CA607_17945 [Caulobacter vibrioides]